MVSKVRHITVTAVKGLEPGEEVLDDVLKGFGVRRQLQSASYFVLKRINGRLRRITIGRHGSPWTPETARKHAAGLMQEIASGADPLARRKLERSVETSFGAVADQFLEVHGVKVKPTTYAVYESLVRIQLKPQFATKPVASITKGDVAKFHAGWSHQPRTANHAISVLSKIFAWAMETGHLPEGDNPCHGIKRFAETKRQRYLSFAELKAIGTTMAEMEQSSRLNPYVAGAIRLLLLTGARLREILTLRWEYVDLERRRLFLPDSKTGAKVITLNAASLALLRSLPRLEGNPFVLPGQRTGRHLVNLRAPWVEICRESKISNVRIHDLRHSFASVAVGQGGSLPIIGKLLGHNQSQTTARYAHIADNPLDELSDATGRAIAEALGVATL